MSATNNWDADNRGQGSWDHEVRVNVDGTLSTAAEPDTAGSDAETGLMFATLDEFVRDFLAEVLWVDLENPNRIWCPDWWCHASAIVRLDALHRSFEQLRHDPGIGMSSWLSEHADPHMQVLTDPYGPFRGCSINKGHNNQRNRIIPTTPAPPGMFDPAD